MGNERLTYYKENVPLLIAKLKTSVTQTLEVIDREIDEDLSGDKFVNVLKAKRQAAEDVVWALKRIDELENELNGTEDNVEEVVSSNPAKRYAKP